MTMKKLLLPLLAPVFLLSAIAQKFEHLAQTPPMGWNSWNCFAQEVSADLGLTVANEDIH